MGFNSAFKGLRTTTGSGIFKLFGLEVHIKLNPGLP